MNDHPWLILALIALPVLMLFVSTGLSHAVAAPGEAAIAASLEATRAANPGWPWDKLDAGVVELGMSKDMVLAALGTPDNVIETADVSGNHEEWAYRKSKYGSVWTQRRDGVDHRYKHPYESVHFDDGIVTGWVER